MTSAPTPDRIVVLDTETTGIEVTKGHRVIEIGCVEIVNRRVTGRTFQTYLNPGRRVDAEVVALTGITDDVLRTAPVFREIGRPFLEFVRDARVVAHNAPFDIGFLNNEMTLAGSPRKLDAFIFDVVDTLEIARRLYPGKDNSLDGLCRRFEVSLSGRRKHGALLDAQLLANVFLMLEVRQGHLEFAADASPSAVAASQREATPLVRPSSGALTVLRATPEELSKHNHDLDELDKTCQERSVWRRHALAP